MPKSSKIVVDFTVNIYEEESKTPTFSEHGVYAQKITYTQVDTARFVMWWKFTHIVYIYYKIV